MQDLTTIIAVKSCENFRWRFLLAPPVCHAPIIWDSFLNIEWIFPSFRSRSLLTGCDVIPWLPSGYEIWEFTNTDSVDRFRSLVRDRLLALLDNTRVVWDDIIITFSIFFLILRSFLCCSFLSWVPWISRIFSFFYLVVVFAVLFLLPISLLFFCLFLSVFSFSLVELFPWSSSFYGLSGRVLKQRN